MKLESWILLNGATRLGANWVQIYTVEIENTPIEHRNAIGRYVNNVRWKA